ncbi:MAG: glycosyltransferase [Myxococcales bacterium]|nr:glycosyltransferase [Myxococcales bacterium]
MSRQLLTILVPVYNEGLNIEPLFQALAPVLTELEHQFDVELLFTDNHSEDNTFAQLRAIGERDPRVRVLRFSRNFGFQRSILTGYLHARGDAAIQIDCDLQDPPALIVQFVQHWQAGYKVVYGVRKGRKEGFFITFARKVFYRLIDRLSDTRLPLDAGDFRLVDRVVLQELGKMEDFHPYLRGAIAAMGFAQIGIAYDRAERLRGESKFNFGKLVALAVDGILNHSVVPLRLATYTGLVVSVLTFIGLVTYTAARLLFGQTWPAGFATLTVLILLSLSLNALFLGVIGEYLGRIYQQVKKRPIAIIEDRVNDSPRSVS